MGRSVFNAAECNAICARIPDIALSVAMRLHKVLRMKLWVDQALGSSIIQHEILFVLSVPTHQDISKSPKTHNIWGTQSPNITNIRGFATFYVHH